MRQIHRRLSLGRQITAGSYVLRRFARPLQEPPRDWHGLKLGVPVELIQAPSRVSPRNRQRLEPALLDLDVVNDYTLAALERLEISTPHKH